MPKDSSIRSVLIIGSGPIIIGQACEFDYSGTQAARSLREEGVKVFLINSNPATIMTDPIMADKVYLLPLTVESIEQILEENQIDAVLPTMGGQTALNLAKEAEDLGIWEKYGVRLIGVDIKAIDKAEDREKFRQWMIRLGVPVATAKPANSFLEGKEFAQDIGFPLVIRPSFTLGGTGGGFVHDKDELDEALGSVRRHVGVVLRVGEADVLGGGLGGLPLVDGELVERYDQLDVFLCGGLGHDGFTFHGDWRVKARRSASLWSLANLCPTRVPGSRSAPWKKPE